MGVNLTIGWFGDSGLRWFTEWSCASLVDCSHTELVLLALDEVFDSKCGLSDRVPVSFGPSRGRRILLLDGVARDGTATVRFRR